MADGFVNDRITPKKRKAVKKPVSAEGHSVMVFQGELQYATFLVSLLESGGISTPMGGAFRSAPAIYVRPSDADDAWACVEDFKRNGKRKD